MTPGSAKTHVQQLVDKYCDGRSVREIERANNIKQGRLNYYVNPAWLESTKRIPKPEVFLMFATALGAPPDEVSQAFIKDWAKRHGSGSASTESDETAARAEPDSIDMLTPPEVELVCAFRELDAQDQLRLREVLDAFLRAAEKISRPTE
jgi:hypothetical protein